MVITDTGRDRLVRNMLRIDLMQRMGVAILIGLIGAAAPAAAEQVFVGGDSTKVDIVDQHPMDRGEGLYDTTPSATGLYDRTLDADTQDPARRYEALPEYFNNSDAKSLSLSLINGAWYCAPTSALSLIKYWDSDPRFPNLFDPLAGDTDRSVLLAVAGLMDTDDLTDNGPADAAEHHLGTLFKDIKPGLETYFNSKYPLLFRVGERAIGINGVTFNSLGYDTAVRRNIPTILTFTGHVGVGLGLDTDFPITDPRHYRVNDPWTGSANIGLDQVGQGRFLPRGAQGVYGISYAEELYGPGAADYNETPWGLLEGALPDAMFWVQPIDDPWLEDQIPAEVVPEPSSLLLLGLGLGVLGRRVKSKRPH